MNIDAVRTRPDDDTRANLWRGDRENPGGYIMDVRAIETVADDAG